MESAVLNDSNQPQCTHIKSGFQEIILTTRNPQIWIKFLTTQAGWELKSTAKMGDELNLWELPNSAKGTAYLLSNKGEDKGYIRLVHLDKVRQEQIRSDDRPWDIGGIFDMNMRVKNLYALREKMIADGWIGESPPIQYVFGPFEVIEWIARGPDGVRIAMIERIKPNLEGWPNLVKMSRVFNSTSIVKDMDKSRQFYENILCMKPYLLSNKPSDSEGPNVLGLPHNMATKISRNVAILHPQGTNDGSIELLQFEGAEGSDFSKQAKPYNFGLSAYRFAVDDIAVSHNFLMQNYMVTSQIININIAPYGRVRIFGFFTPDGIWIELFEIMAQQ
ncbi:hypothetical protein LPB140_00945 [Sphingorhabdus lutea]|uniref:VOC domain-containing protein n=2 Tax=Sphingorhabdus lutea TaxID=1913578 RepID=A0A1L3J950_9SPHN|nr:hypothetical protein LPB140_00945 [Sphingorhabdus lutea]